MPQFQVDSEQIQSSSAAVSASIQRFDKRYRACTAISTTCRASGGAARPHSSMPWPNNGVRRSSRWNGPWNPFNMRSCRPPRCTRTRKCRRPAYSHSSGGTSSGGISKWWHHPAWPVNARNPSPPKGKTGSRNVCSLSQRSDRSVISGRSVAHVGASGRSGCRRFRLVGHHSFGGQEQACDGGCVLQGGTGDLDRVGDAGGQ